ncbi:hypothetical protein [Streptomyces sp. NPDC002785]
MADNDTSAAELVEDELVDEAVERLVDPTPQVRHGWARPGCCRR